jgi:hypothetical protein
MTEESDGTHSDYFSGIPFCLRCLQPPFPTAKQAAVEKNCLIQLLTVTTLLLSTLIKRIRADSRQRHKITGLLAFNNILDRVL